MNSTTYGNFTISAEYTGSKPAPADSGNTNHSFVTVRSGDTNRAAVFDAWTTSGHAMLTTHGDLMAALFNIVMEVSLGANDFEDFCSAIGYDENDPKAKANRETCRASYTKFINMSDFNNDELNDLLIALEG